MLGCVQKGVHQWLLAVICLDGYHLKGEYGGQLLCAIGKDGNGEMFLIAFAIAKAETRESWQWFITILLEDLDRVASGLGWATMSDMQKVFDVIF
jgi:hypothetical protein